MYAYPSKFPDELMSTIANNPKICNYIDIPLQHISDNLLKSMRRGVTSKRTRELIYKLKENIPDVTIRTTFIVGYPGETEENFNELCEFVKEIKFDRFGVFTFSQEENTASYILGDPISVKIKEERKKILMSIQQEVSLQKNQSFVGKDLKVLIENVEGSYYIGRSYRDAPEVDGEVLIKSDSNNIEIGKFYNVRVNDFDEYDLFGTLKKRWLA